jgi:hypothetical protein
MDDTEISNVQSLNLKKDPHEAAAENVIRQAPSIARMRKALFESYRAEGFSEEQSLLLCTK